MPEKVETIVKDLITKQVFKTQTDLVTALKAQGIVVKQSTISRILHRLGAVKRANGDGDIGYQILQTTLTGNPLYNQRLVHKIAHNEAMIMIHTRSGSAGHVAQYVDEQRIPAIMGTIAGDNSILVLPASVNDIPTIIANLSMIFPNSTQ